MIYRYTERKFVETAPTVDSVIIKKILRANDFLVQMNFWDTAGMEKFQSIPTGNYRGSHGAVVVYDVTKRETFEAALGYIEVFMAYSSNESANNIILVGNKCDDKDKREVLF